MSAKPTLGEDAFVRAFPFYLQLDASLSVVAAGPSLIKVVGSDIIGLDLLACFKLSRPQSPDVLRMSDRLEEQTCYLTALTDPPFTLRGGMERLENGGALLLVSPALSGTWAPSSYGLKLNDFAKHDVVADAMLLTQTTKLSLKDAAEMSQRLRTRSEELTTIMELSNRGVICFDTENHVAHVNTPALEMLQLQRSEVLSMSLAEVDQRLLAMMTPKAQRAGPPMQRRLHEIGNSDEADFIELAKPSTFQMHMRFARGGDSGAIFYFRDVTQERAIDRMKSEFLSTAAHELRTPMVSILGFSELMLKRNYPAHKQAEMLETIYRQSGAMVKIINDLLDLARIEARRGLDLKIVPVSLPQLVQETICGLTLPTDARQVALGPIPNIDVLADADKIQLALQNLLSNAYKYSPDGGEITLACEMVSKADESCAVITITDRGIGMSPYQLDQAFERFYRADTSGKVPGTGLGLSLAKEIAELHQGRIELSSKLGLGTSAALWLPINSAVPQRRVQESVAESGLPVS